MILLLPDALTHDNLDRLALTGEFQLLTHASDLSQLTIRWTLNPDETTLTWDFATRIVEIPDDASALQITTLQDAFAAWGQLPSWDAAARQILNLAQSAVGVDIRDLTVDQIKALLAMLLWNSNAIGDDLAVRPLREWITRRPDE